MFIFIVGFAIVAFVYAMIAFMVSAIVWMFTTVFGLIITGVLIVVFLLNFFGLLVPEHLRDEEDDNEE